jgi:hypothetical protein
MTNADFNRQFRANIEPGIKKHFPNDLPALREAWGNELELYARDGKVTESQRNNWRYPKQYRDPGEVETRKKLKGDKFTKETGRQFSGMTFKQQVNFNNFKQMIAKALKEARKHGAHDTREEADRDIIAQALAVEFIAEGLKAEIILDPAKDVSVVKVLPLLWTIEEEDDE